MADFVLDMLRLGVPVRYPDRPLATWSEALKKV